MNIVRKKSMDQLIGEIDVCKKCRLYKHAKHAVPGEGNINASLMLVGEAPGANEDLQGRPFVGAAGQFLEEVLASVGLARKNVYITNVVKHRPPNNRLPRKDEAEACTPYLQRQIAIVKPRVITSLGNCSSTYLLSQIGFEYARLTDIRGRVFSGKLFGTAIEVIPTFHPAAILYARVKADSIRQDFELAKTALCNKSQK